MNKLTLVNPAAGRQQRGVGMIEVLISMLVISLSVLNIAGLQTAAKKSNFEGVQRTSAIILARDIAEKMRGNPLSLDGYLTSGIGGGTLTQPSIACTAASKCSSQQLSNYDLWLWEDLMDGASETRDIDGVNTETGGMSNPTGCITGPASGGAGVYTVSIIWRGLAELANVSADNCGVGSGKYGASEEFRRILSFNIYVTP